MKIEGIPDGWELVRIGSPLTGEFILSYDAIPVSFDAKNTASRNCVIIRRIPPPLSIPPKVFADGWIVGQSTGPVLWSRSKPEFVNGEGWKIDTATFLPIGHMPCLRFDSGLIEANRICRVTWEHGSECNKWLTSPNQNQRTLGESACNSAGCASASGGIVMG